jgi:hypothetical protein
MLSPLEATLTKNRGRGSLPPGSMQKPEGSIALRLLLVLLAFCLALDEPFFQHLLVAEPQIGDIG